jgi:hypothetical protein
VTGDRDGLLLELDQWRSEDTLEVNIFESTRTTVSPNHGSKERALWGEVVTTPRAKVQIRFGELEQGPVRRPFTERSAVLAERVGGELCSYQEFSFSLRDDLKRDDEDCVYVRAEQIDDEVAWSSPVWITWR